MADKKEKEKRHSSVIKEKPPTNYFETLVHLFKGNVGTGVFGLGDAFKNGGMVVSVILTVLIGVVCVHCQHILVSCSDKMRILRGEEKCVDYAETVDQVFESGPEKFRSWAKPVKTVVNVFICVTQLGFCCVYIVFVSSNLRQILKDHGYELDIRVIMLIVYVPILLTALITSLKFLAPVSLVANICQIIGLFLVLFFAVKDGLPSPMDRNQVTDLNRLSLCFGTVVFAYASISLVLPLRNAMLIPTNFERPLGVLNVGMTIVGALYVFVGFVGYLKWGEEVGASLTLNLGETIFAQCVKGLVTMAVLMSYALQFYIPITIMLPSFLRISKLENRPYMGELLFRFIMVTVTLIVAELVPELGLFMSLIGAFASTALCLVVPPLLEFLLTGEQKKGPLWWLIIKNTFILILAMIGFLIGTYESIYQIIEHYRKEE